MQLTRERREWPTALLGSTLGALVGYSAALLTWPELGRWLAGMCVTYGLVLGVVLVRGVSWMHEVAHAADGAAAITFDLGEEFVRLDLTLTISGVAYFLALALPNESAVSGRLPLAVSGATCGAVAIVVRSLWPSRGRNAELGS
jgi:hypothetical protein